MLKSVSLRFDEELHRKIKKFAASRRLNFTQAFILILESTRIVVLEEGVEILNCLNRLDGSIKANGTSELKQENIERICEKTWQLLDFSIQKIAKEEKR